jgi:hypothetical protein
VALFLIIGKAKGKTEKQKVKNGLLVFVLAVVLRQRILMRLARKICQ